MYEIYSKMREQFLNKICELSDIVIRTFLDNYKDKDQSNNQGCCFNKYYNELGKNFTTEYIEIIYNKPQLVHLYLYLRKFVGESDRYWNPHRRIWKKTFQQPKINSSGVKNFPKQQSFLSNGINSACQWLAVLELNTRGGRRHMFFNPTTIKKFKIYCDRHLPPPVLKKILVTHRD